ncbi:hypothetical protein OM960_01565 [Defluviimonas sp. CAU 1641]|uniref:Uncharacterized protein n=2 Tax=Defluviimonas salinarum TaxID=2992147 RepID=A0ABT3IXW2_9RHOB|nr:hypothetical protein [Defluviimonas salinarum]
MNFHPYARLMSEEGIAIVFNLDLSEPVEISDFVSAFSGLGSQFERHLRTARPDLEGEVKIYVKEVRKGSIEAELIPLAYNTLITVMDHSQIITGFVKSISDKIAGFQRPGGRLEGATKSELTQIVDTVAAVANDPDGKATVSAIRYRKTEKITEFSLEFDTRQAQAAIMEIDAQYKEIASVTDFDHENKLLTFYQSNRRDSDKTGEKGIIEDISPKPLAVVYASELAKERIKSEMLDGDRNIYKLGFFVDVNVQMRSGKPVAYRIKSVRDVIELPDEE